MAGILVTGAGGFIGRGLCPEFSTRGHHVVAGLHRGSPPAEFIGADIEPRLLGDIAPGRDWSRELRGVDVVIHLAQRAHRRAADRDLAREPEAAAALLSGAAAAGAKRFVYVSSIKAMGETTAPGQPFRAADPPHPEDAYGRMKLTTEQALARAVAGTAVELVILRPPLVYGPGVGGNFRALLRLAGSGLPLPFATVDNCRSLICRDNLVDLLAVVATHPAAAGEVWLGGDGEDRSTAALIRVLARGQGRAARLFALPDLIFAAVRVLPGLGAPVRRLTQSLQVDDARTRRVLGWVPPVAAEAALIATARAFRAERADAAGPV